MRVIVTKYLMTTIGIIAAEAESVDADSVVIRQGTVAAYDDYFHGNDWHATKRDARAAVETAIAIRRRHLERHLAALDGLEASAMHVINGSDLPEGTLA